MVAGFMSERWPTSNRNTRPASVGIRTESAVTALHIAMEASFQITLRVLRERGTQNPSAIDAGNFIEKVFGGLSDGLPYFRDWYADRIMTSHPSSRFGTFAYPPLEADDYYDLRDSLHHVYVYLITGEVMTYD